MSSLSGFARDFAECYRIRHVWSSYTRLARLILGTSADVVEISLVLGFEDLLVHTSKAGIVVTSVLMAVLNLIVVVLETVMDMTNINLPLRRSFFQEELRY